MKFRLKYLFVVPYLMDLLGKVRSKAPVESELTEVYMRMKFPGVMVLIDDILSREYDSTDLALAVLEERMIKDNWGEPERVVALMYLRKKMNG